MISLLGFILGLLAFNLYLDWHYRPKSTAIPEWTFPPLTMYTLNNVYEESSFLRRDLTEDEIEKLFKGG